MNSGIKLGTVISISVDGVWAGSGNLVAGRIENCGAQFCDDNDDSLAVYDLIEDAIGLGKSRLFINLDGKRSEVTWTITEPS